jgi:hypothetical protein
VEEGACPELVARSRETMAKTATYFSGEIDAIIERREGTAFSRAATLLQISLAARLKAVPSRFADEKAAASFCIVFLRDGSMSSAGSSTYRFPIN